MPKESIVQIRMDSDIKKDVEELYRKMGTSFAEFLLYRVSRKKAFLLFQDTMKTEKLYLQEAIFQHMLLKIVETRKRMRLLMQW